MIDLDEKIDKLRGENRQLKLTNQSLQRDLELAHRAVKWRENPIRFSYSDNSAPYPFLKHALYSLAIAVFTMWLVNSFKKT
jgi:hypothetical protein